MPPCPPARRQQDTFSIRLAQLEVFANDDRTRTFLSLAAQQGAGAGNSTRSSDSDSDSGGDNADGGDSTQRQPAYSSQLVGLCHAVSTVFAAHGLPRFHSDPRPHASGGCPCAAPADLLMPVQCRQGRSRMALVC